MQLQAQSNYHILCECFADRIIQRSAAPSTNTSRRKTKGRKRSLNTGQNVSILEEHKTNEADDLAEFVNYITSELFDTLPKELQEISFAAIKNDSSLANRYSSPLSTDTVDLLLLVTPSSVVDSMVAYALIASEDELRSLFSPVLDEYIREATKPPLPHDPSQKAKACEICLREWIPLTYHHLIPRQIHAKALKRRWYEEWQLHSVAWLCRACHSLVHRIASNEELAKEWYSVERLLEREDVQDFANWISRARWKPR